MAEFEHLKAPYSFKQFYSNYPEGYSIYEALLSWLDEVNKMIDVLNLTLDEWSKLNELISKELQSYAEEQLLTWLTDGTLDDVINVVLNNKLDKAVYEEDKLTFFAGPHTISLINYPKQVSDASDSERFNRAVEDVPLGGVLVISEDLEMSEQITIQKPICIEGNGSTITPQMGGIYTTFLFSNTSNVAIRNLKFNQNLIGRSSISFLFVDDFEVSGCYFTGYTNEYGYYQTDSAIRLDDSDRGKLLGNTFYEHGFQLPNEVGALNRCISVQGTSSNTVIANNMFEKVHQAIITDSPNNLLITNNTFKEVKDNSIYLLGTAGTVISGNTFQDGLDEAIVVFGNGIQITGNTFRNENVILVTNGEINGLNFTGNNVFNSGRQLTHILKMRPTSVNVKNISILNNSFIADTRTNAFPYFDCGFAISNLRIENNYFDLATISGMTGVITFIEVITGTFKNNSIVSTNATDLFISLPNISGLNFKVDSNLANCRICMMFRDGIKVKNQFVRFDLNSYVQESSTNIMYGNAAPTGGNYNRGDIVYSMVPSAGGYVGWVCTATGSPGTWKGFGLIQS